MIDDNKNIILIDFDRMIKIDEKNSKQIDEKDSKETQRTNNFNTIFTAPELKKESNQSYSCDIFSFGMILYYVILEKEPNLNDYCNELYNVDPKFNELFKKCVNIDPNQRPNINYLVKEFYLNYKSQIQFNKFFKGCEEYVSNFCEFSLAVDLRNSNKDISSPEVQFEIAESLKTTNYEKAFYFYKLSADKNYSKAQFMTGIFYLRTNYLNKNIKEAIHYLKLSCDNNNKKAQFFLGLIYYDGIFITRDINKANYYFQLASNQNHEMAQLYLGNIYYKGENGQVNMTKAIEYLKKII